MDDMFESTVGDLLEAACPTPKRLEEICPKLEKVELPSTWTPASLAATVLEVIINLAESDKKGAN